VTETQNYADVRQLLTQKVTACFGAKMLCELRHMLARLVQVFGAGQRGETIMDNSNEFAPVYLRHDLMIEIGRLEMAMDHLEERDQSQQQQLRPRLESRMSHLLSELDHLPA
jgi:hypothetical protein